MKKLIKSTAILTLSNVITKVTSLLFFIILARLMSIQDYGALRYLIAVSSVYAIGFTGVPTALANFIPKSKKDTTKLTSNAVVLMGILFIISIIATIIFEKNWFYLSLLIFALLIDSFYLGFCQGILNYVKLAGFKFTENALQLILLVSFFFILGTLSLNLAIIFYSISGILALLGFEVWNRELKIKLNISKKIILDLVKYTLPVSAGAIGWTLLVGINTIIIERMLNTENVAYYSVGITLTQVFMFLPMAISTILLPKTAALKDKTKLIKPLSFAILGTIATSCILLIALIIFKNEIITLLFKKEYLATAIIILPLGLAQICIALHQIIASVWQGIGKPIVPSITISIAAFVNLALSLSLTTSNGIVGAAISYAIASLIAVVLISSYFMIKWKTLSKT